MNSLTLALAFSVLVAGVRCTNVYAYSAPVVHTAQVVHPAPVVHAPLFHSAAVVHHTPEVVHHTPAVVHHTPVVHQTVVRRPSVTQHHEVVHVPNHEFGYSVEHAKVVQPKSTIVHHHPLTGLPYHQVDFHHTPLVTGSRSSVHQSRLGYVLHRTKTIAV
ncbi:hypothetical protein MRX96_009393 [Rhipicephalus microplus]